MPTSLVNVRRIRVDGASLHDPPAEDDLLRALSRLLDASPLCAWSTVTAAQAAHVNIGHFAYSDDLHLYLISHPGSQHSFNVRANPSMAVAVYESAQPWGGHGRGVQLFGTCWEVPPGAEADARSVYGARFRSYAQWTKTVRHGDMAEEYRFYCFAPDRVKVMDEEAFGDAVLITADILRPIH